MKGLHGVHACHHCMYVPIYNYVYAGMHAMMQFEV